MAVMAAEPVAAEAAGGSGALAGAAAGMPGGGEGREKNRGVLLALGIILLWLAGVAFFFAFEGLNSIEQSGTTGSSLFKSLIGGLADKAQAQENQNQGG